MRSNTDFKVTGGLLVLALAVGGAGVAFPRLAMLLQICALVVAAYFVTTRRIWRFQPLTSLALLLLGGILLLPLLQLVPLPPEVWTALPGRELPRQLDDTLGYSRWRPLSLDIEGTIRSFLTLLPAAVVFVGSLFLSKNERVQLVWVVLAFAVLGALLGIVQLTSGGSVTPFSSSHFGYPVGLFVNRNHNAALLLVGMVLTGALGASQIRRGKPRIPRLIGSLSTIIILGVVVVGTTSRMGLILLPVCFAAALRLLFLRGSVSRLALGSVAVVAVVVSVIFASGGFDRTFARFSGLDDARFDYWTDVQWALQYYGLAGTGFGTFVPVYKSAESLTALSPRTVNHAHNDYLEILLEGGIPATLLFLLFSVIVALALLRSFKRESQLEQVLPAAAAALGVAVLLALSVVDYPLRMPALSVVFAVFCAVLLPSSSAERALEKTSRRRNAAQRLATTARGRLYFPARAAAISIIIVGAVVVVQAGMSANQLLTRQYAAAVQWAPWSTQAHEHVSTEALLRNRLSDAASHGYSGVALSPISAPAIRTVGLTNLAENDVAEGNRLMQIAVILGWRDPLTQLWAIKAAETSREPEKALQRAQALFQQHQLVAPAITLLLDTPSESRVLPMLADDIARKPTWRSAFFKASDEIPISSTRAWLQLVQLLTRSKAPVTVDEGQPMLKLLLAAGRNPEAQRLWELLRGDEIVSNGDFELRRSRRGTVFPTHWHVSDRNRYRLSVGTPQFDRTTRALHVRGDLQGLILFQTLMLKPGRYRFSYKARVASPQEAQVQWELHCEKSGLRQQAEAEVQPARGWEQITSTFSVPTQQCAVQRLALRASPAKATDDLWLDEIRLGPLSD